MTSSIFISIWIPVTINQFTFLIDYINVNIPHYKLFVEHIFQIIVSYCVYDGYLYFFTIERDFNIYSGMLLVSGMLTTFDHSDQIKHLYEPIYPIIYKLFSNRLFNLLNLIYSE